MHELVVEDAVLGKVIVTFDGRVLELFRPGMGSVHRMHVRHLARVEQSGPDRRGHYRADFSSIERGGFELTARGDVWPEVTDLIETLGPPVAGP